MFAEMPLDNWAVDAFPAFGRLAFQAVFKRHRQRCDLMFRGGGVVL
jgi:hypothetical protein